MFIQEKAIEVPEYGYLVHKKDLMKEIENLLREERIIFTPGYMDEECVKLKKAEELLMLIKMQLLKY